MQPMSVPVVKDLVLIGGGHSHALVLRMWAMNPLPGVRLTVINPGPVAPYTGMLPGLIAGHYRRDEIMIDLIRLARFAGATAILDRVTGIDREARQVHLAGRPPIAYDLASVDIGITSDLAEIPGFADHATAAKPLGSYAERWQAFVDRGLERPAVAVIGAGVGGAELALASRHRLGPAARITLLEQGSTPLSGIGSLARKALLAALSQADIPLLTQARVAAISQDEVTLADGRRIAADFSLAVAGSRPQPWLGKTGLALSDGFITVNRQLQSSDPAIFAAGDCADLAFAPRPKAGVFAVRAAPILFHNLRASLTDSPMRAFHPQRDYLKLISTGEKSAIADKWHLPLRGRWLWRWKDRIDRKFMAMFADYPQMAQVKLAKPAVPDLVDLLAERPLCGGCGAKLAAGDLSRALAGVPAPQRDDVLSGRGDDAAILRAGKTVQLLTTDHLRAFTPDARLMARITALHAMGDIWAMGARPQVALAQVTLPRLAADKSAAMLADIMDEAVQVFRAAGADVVGGHTSVGAEMTIGFTVTGTADRAITKAGAMPGDVLILTKPIGSGTILAAEMAMVRVPGTILGEAVANAYAVMCRSNADAAAVLAPVAHAMTDVTGFGLAGHLLEILDASGCAARLDLDLVPTLPGALALAAAGEGSSLAPSNRAAAVGRVTGRAAPEDQAARALLFDPQTSGGLLASIPAAAAAQVLQALGGDACAIGAVVAGEPGIHLT